MAQGMIRSIMTESIFQINYTALGHSCDEYVQVLMHVQTCLYLIPLFSHL
jgi:hypothetical protein